MTVPGGEMPFLDHLEELRMRLLRALGAIVVGFGVGLWLVEKLHLVALLKAPIASYLPSGKLTFTSPTEPLMIVFKLGFVVGLLLASPVLIYQAWAFLSPALYDRERKVIFPALVMGLGLFLVGASLGYIFVVPQALRVFFSFQAESLQPMITYDAWFGFVLQIVLALGLSFELPLVIIIMAALGVVTPAGLHRFRRYAVVLSFVAGAVLSPGADVFSMLMMTVPLLLLYEIGVAGAAMIARRRLRDERAAMLPVLFFALLLGGLATPAAAQGVPTPGRAAGQDTTRAPPGRAPGQVLDTAQARRLGLPTAPSQSFAPEDSAYRSLLGRPGYTVTKYRADSAAILAVEKQLMLMGHAMTEREGTTMEADDITYTQPDCMLEATGDPRIFNEGQVLVGEKIEYNTCRSRGVFADALTNFKQGSTTWFLRGDVAKDSLNNRIFAGHGDITSCDLPIPHYHFNAREIKWVSNTVLVARPVVLYIQDVPVLWLPFIFQDLRPGRHSGLLIPAFGFSDIIRPSPSYSRQITNVGYYWATNDYMDITGRINWFSGRYVALGFQTDYRWLNRFLSGTFGDQQAMAVGRGVGVRTALGSCPAVQPHHRHEPVGRLCEQHPDHQQQCHRPADQHPADQQPGAVYQEVPLGQHQPGRQSPAGYFQQQLYPAAPVAHDIAEAHRTRLQLDLVSRFLPEPGPGGGPATGLPEVRHAIGRDRLGPAECRHPHHRAPARHPIPIRQLQLAEYCPVHGRDDLGTRLHVRGAAGHQYHEPERLACRGAVLCRQLSQRVRLGYRHQPSLPAPRHLEDPADPRRAERHLGRLCHPESQHGWRLGGAGQARSLQSVDDTHFLRLLQRGVHSWTEPHAPQHQSAPDLVVRPGSNGARGLCRGNRPAGAGTDTSGASRRTSSRCHSTRTSR